MPEELWMEVHMNVVQVAVFKTIPKKCKNAKCLSDKSLQIAEKRKDRKAKEKRKDIHLNAEFQRIARRDKKAFLSENAKK